MCYFEKGDSLLPMFCRSSFLKIKGNDMIDVKAQLIQQALLPETSEKQICNALQVLKNGLPKENESHRFLSDTEACQYCGNIARSTLWRWRKQGLKSYQVGGRTLYRISDLDAFIMLNVNQQI
jgi:predicted DNA-binding transcriptional regulator AlpA